MPIVSSTALVAAPAFMMSRHLRRMVVCVVLLGPMLAQRGMAQDEGPDGKSSNCTNGATIQGKVDDSKEVPLVGASITLSDGAMLRHADAISDTSGKFVFSNWPAGSYRIAAEKDGLSSFVDIRVADTDCMKSVDMVLLPTANPATIRASRNSDPREMRFADDPKFTIAGVTDWTAIGGHGSDSMLKMSESLANQTVKLQSDDLANVSKHRQGILMQNNKAEKLLRGEVSGRPGDFGANFRLGKLYVDEGRCADAIPFLETAHKIAPDEKQNDDELGTAYSSCRGPHEAAALVHELLQHSQSAGLNEIAASLDEKNGDTLEAAQEFATASRLDPSAQSYLAWGSDLLVHRAVWQSLEVFRSGMRLYPKSILLQTATASALFAGARYQDATKLLCEVTDEHPDDSEAYIDMGEMQLAAPSALPCVESKLAWFAQQNTRSPSANYLYAMAVLKRDPALSSQSDRNEMKELLTKAVSVNPRYGAAYLQLGIIAASEDDYVKAIKCYKKSIEVEPQVPDAYYRLGVAYDHTLQKDKAREAFRLHDQVQQEQQREVQQQRLQLKQFLFVEPPEKTKIP